MVRNIQLQGSQKSIKQGWMVIIFTGILITIQYCLNSYLCLTDNFDDNSISVKLNNTPELKNEELENLTTVYKTQINEPEKEK